MSVDLMMWPKTIQRIFYCSGSKNFLYIFPDAELSHLEQAMKLIPISIYRSINKLCGVILACIIIYFSSMSICIAQPPKVVFLAPEPQDNLFWGQVADFMTAVSEDLDMELEVIFAPATGSYILKRLGMKIASREEKPDYLLTGYWGDVTDAIMQSNKEKDIQIFIFNTGINRDERRVIGHPRGQFSNWIGHLSPDDKSAGSKLAELLIAKTYESTPGIKPKIAGLAGGDHSPVSSNRLTGLKQSVSKDRQASISKIYNTTWDKKSAVHATENILRDQPDTNIIWTVSDALALGSIDVAKSSGRFPGKDIFMGGFDWSPEAFDAIKRGEMTASMGGHFMEGGWALIMIYDYHNGIDFKGDPGLSSTTNMQAITADNVHEFEDKLGNRDWRRIDFKAFSKFHNSELSEYQFTIDAILSHLN